MNCFNIIRDKTGVCVPFRRFKNLDEAVAFYTKMGFKVLKKPKRESAIIIQLSKFELHVGVFSDSDRYFWHYRLGRRECTDFEIFKRTRKPFVIIGR